MGRNPTTTKEVDTAFARPTSGEGRRPRAAPGEIQDIPSSAQHPIPYLAPRAIRVEREGDASIIVPLYTDRTYSFGRGPECTFIFPSDRVSRLHGQLSFDSQNRWVYRDLNSSNGSFLVKGELPTEGDPREERARIQRETDRAMRPGFALLLGESKSRVVFLEELPEALDEGPAGRRSPATRALERRVQMCARHRLPVLLFGPSGSGKTYWARAIHDQSGLPGQFVNLNCGRLPTDAAQLTSELLGHVKGAFTGAAGARQGKLMAANNGTLFLDEVESLHPEAQEFLLDVLEDSGSYVPLGADGSTARPHFRLLSASKRPLAESALRPDLCQRLAGDFISLPGLEERREDIPWLVSGFLRVLLEQQQLDAELTEEAIRFLAQHDWPGQVRELETTVKVVVAREQARLALDNPRATKVRVSLTAVREYLDERQRGFGARPPAPDLEATAYIRKRPQDLTEADIRGALERQRGNKTHAASVLGIAVNTLKARMRELGIPLRAGEPTRQK